MSLMDEVAKATTNFYAWEERGRGWKVFAEPVQLEPVFVPFFPYKESTPTVIDDGRRPRLIGRLFSAVADVFESNGKSNEPTYEEELAKLYEHDAYLFPEDAPLKGYSIIFPDGCNIPPDAFIHFLIFLSDTEYPISFEIIGEERKITIQIVCRESDSYRVKSQIHAFFDHAVIRESDEYINDIFDPKLRTRTIDFGLESETTIPINQFGKNNLDPFKGFFGLLEQQKSDERVMLQVLFQRVVNRWGESILDSITSGDGSCFFMDAPDMLPLAREKVECPLFSCVMRVAVQSTTVDQCESLLQEAVTCISAQSNSGGNNLMPLPAGEMLNTEQIPMFQRRTTRRLGMILNVRELATFVHYPNSTIFSRKLSFGYGKTKEAPSSLSDTTYVLGESVHLGKVHKVGLDVEVRLRHIHIIGATGTGKSTLLSNLIIQDIVSRKGVGLLDPHGDLVEDILGHIPPERIQDVVLVDPSDSGYPIGLNILSAKSEIEKIVLSSDLVTAIKRQSTSWGDQMTAVLSNAINAFLESSVGGSLFDLRRFLTDDSFRKEFLKTVDDPTIIQFWQKEYAMLRKNAIAPILIRLDTFLRPKIIRNMMAQRTGLDIGQILESNKILLVKLPQGLIGEENSYLLGTLFVAKIQQAAQARQAISRSERKPFFLYMDEFQNFITPSMSAILSGSRKYGLGLILAHQGMDQIGRDQSELTNSILTNPATRICFRLGENDARLLERGFSFFDASDLQNLHVGQAIAKVDTTTQDFNLSTQELPSADEEKKNSNRVICVARARDQFAVEREIVEAQIFAMYGLQYESSHNNEKKPEIKEESPENSDPLATKTITEKAEEFIRKKEEIEQITEHRQIQTLVKKMAETLGFKSVIEEPIDNGEGRVDIGLSRDEIRIAIEVSVTNTETYEVGNILKCLGAGYQTIIMCSKSQTHLNNIRRLALSKLEDKYHSKVLFQHPDEIFGYLQSLVIKESPKEQRIKGYRVKVTYKEP